MEKSFLLAIFLIGCLLVQASSAVPSKTQSKPASRTYQIKNADEEAKPDETPDDQAEVSSDETAEEQEDEDEKPDQIPQENMENHEEDEDEDESEEEDSDEEEEPENELPLPFLTCLLFENNSACDGTCSLVGSIYGQPVSSGVCGGQNECKCNISPDASLADYWNAKFDSEDVLGEILKNKKLSKKVLSVLKTPFRTPQETISDLKKLLNETQLQSVRPKDKSVQKIFLADGKFDHSAVKKYAAKNLKSLEAQPEDSNFARTLTKFLRGADKQTFDRVHDEIRHSGNKFLNKILNEFMNARSISRPPLSAEDDEENLIDLLDAAVINKLVKSPPRDPSTRRDTVLNLSSSRARGGSASWYKLRGFRKSEVAQLQRGNKCWDGEGYYKVCLSRNGPSLALNWFNEKDGVTVVVDISNKNEINQKWYFRNVAVINLTRKRDGKYVQTWKLGDTTYGVGKDSNGVILGETWTPVKDEASVEKYKQLIKSWCDENEYMVGKNNCIIY